MASNITFDIIGRDRSGSDAFDKVSRSANRADGAMSKFSAGAAKVAKAGMFALGAGAVIAGKGLYEMAQSAAQDELAQRKLALTLKNTTGATDAQIASVERWITAQGKALGVADDDLRPALQRLAEGSGDVAEAQRLASIAMDASAGTGRSLKSVSEALLRAQNGATSGLSRYGIATKDAKGETLSFEEVTRKMAQTFEGQAEKAADTTAGKFARLKLILSETGEEIGAKLIPYASDLADAFMDKGVPAIESFGDKAGPVFRNLVEAGGDIKDAVQPAVEEIAEALGNLATEGAGAGQAFDNVFIPALRGTADVVADVVNFVDNLPGPVKDLGVQAAIAALALHKVNGAMIAVKGSGFIATMTDATSRTDAFKSAARGAAGVGGILALTHGMQEADDKTKALLTTAGGIATGFAVGGPAGAAIGGMAGLVLGLKDRFTGAEEAAANLRREQLRTEAMSGYKAMLDGLRGSLDEVTGAYTANTRAAVLQRLQEEDMIGMWGDGLVSNRTMVSAVLGHEGAMRQLNRAYNQSMGTVGEVHPAIEHLGDEFSDASNDARDHADAVYSLGKRLGVTGKELRAIPKEVRIAIRDDVPDSLREIKNLAKETGNLDRKTIKILLEAANIPATKKNIQDVQKELKETDNQETNPPVGIDDRPFKGKNAAILRELRALDREFVSPASTLSLDEYYRRRAELIASMRSIPDEEVTIWTVRRDRNPGGGPSGGGPDLGYERTIPGLPTQPDDSDLPQPTLGRQFAATQSRALSRSTGAYSSSARRMVIEVKVLPGELDLTKSKQQIDGRARVVFADEFHAERTFERQQR